MAEMTIQDSDSRECALLLRVSDRSLHAYIQQYPFCTGPDETLNRKCFGALREQLEIRQPKVSRPIEPLGRSELADEEAIRLAAREILRNIGLGEADCDKRLRNRAWKLCLARSDAKSVLALGCGEGDEIAALRARAPRSRILGLDWVDKCLPGLLDAAKADFIHGDFNDRLGEHKETFDLVFSNHVIEHSFDPDELLRSIRASLKPGGQLVSAIPLDGEAESPIFRQALSLAREPDRIRRSDMFLMLGGHPYKTNASEFAETLLGAGFQAVRVAYRPWSPTCYNSLDEDALTASRATHMKLHGASTRLLSTAVNGVFSNNPPLAALRALGAVDSRWPFGLIRMHTHKSMEAVVIAYA